MNLITFSIKHFNNNIEVYSAKEIVFSSSWFLEFGKFISEIFNTDEKLIYTITKQFQFWKWRMVYHIKQDNVLLPGLISKNNRRTIYSIEMNQMLYEIKVNYKKRFSIFKDGVKVAEIDESSEDSEFKGSAKLLLLDKKDLEISFLLFSCLKIGETDQRSKGLSTSQKELEVNTDPWS